MKTKLDQISIPPMCRYLSEMAHTLVGKAMPLQLNGHGFNPMWWHFARLSRLRDTMEIFFVFCFFLCFDFVPFVGDPQE